MRNDREKLLDILETIDRIEKYASKGKLAFENDELVQTWILHHLQIIGEAARSLSSTFRESHQEVPWKLIVAMRNILVHEYFSIDIDEIWATVERDIPALKVQIQTILNHLP